MNGKQITDVFNTFVVQFLNLTYLNMKKFAFFSLFLMVSFWSFSQTVCGDADSDLLYAYSHVKDSYESNNISHLKYYAKRSFDAFERSKSKLKACGCDAAFELAYKGAELLAKVDHAPTYEDGRFFVKRAKEIAQQSIVELDKFTVGSPSNISVNDHNLSTIQSEKEKLEKLQKELEAKEAKVKAQLAAQNEKEEQLKKAKLIEAYNDAIVNNLATYKKILEICDCDPATLKDIAPKENKDIESESLEEIRLHLIEAFKTLTSNYLSHLNLCED